MKVESKPISFRLDAAQPFDDRCLSWQYDAKTVSIWTVHGRLKGISFACSPEQLTTLREHRQGECDLVQRDGVFYLAATCEVPEPPRNENPQNWIGVDLGIANIATTSTGFQAAGRGLSRHRKRMRELRAKLQRKGTKSAKRTLKRLNRAESRRARDVNHVISKRIVAEAERTRAGISLEDLSGIRRRARLSSPGRAALHSWALPSSASSSPTRPGAPASRSSTSIRPTRVRPARVAPTWRDATGSASPGSYAGRVGSPCTPTGTLPATSPAGQRLRGTRGGRHPPLPPERWLDAGANLAASEALPASSVSHGRDLDTA
jgi:IS605 OrfB family transposase